MRLAILAALVACASATAFAQAPTSSWYDTLPSIGHWLSPAAWLAQFSSNLSNNLLHVLTLTLTTMLLLCAVMVIATFIARALRHRAEARKAVFDAHWEPYLFERMAGEQVALPTLARRDRVLFLLLWLRLHGYVKGEAITALTNSARELGLEQFAMQLLASWRTWKRMVGLGAVALLATPKAVTRLPKIAQKSHPRFAYLATDALLRIDPARGLTALEHTLATRDWFPAAMSQMIRPHGASALALVEAAVREADPAHTRRLVRLVEGLNDVAATPILRERLPLATEPEEVAAIMHALGRMGTHEDRELVLARTHDESWLVRMECARALGRIGMDEDASVLADLSRDIAWWVRYRATEALIALSGEVALDARAHVEQDAFARDMMRHVLAEQVK
jgi:hypothetical protein